MRLLSVTINCFFHLHSFKVSIHIWIPISVFEIISVSTPFSFKNSIKLLMFLGASGHFSFSADKIRGLYSLFFKTSKKVLVRPFFLKSPTWLFTVFVFSSFLSSSSFCSFSVSSFVSSIEISLVSISIKELSFSTVAKDSSFIFLLASFSFCFSSSSSVLIFFFFLKSI